MLAHIDASAHWSTSPLARPGIYPVTLLEIISATWLPCARARCARARGRAQTKSRTFGARGRFVRHHFDFQRQGTLRGARPPATLPPPL